MKERKQTILAAVALVAFAVAGVFYYLNSGRTNREPTGMMVHGIDLATGEEVQQFYPRGSTQPYESPTTGERTVFTWFYNRKTNMLVVPNLVQRGGVWTVPIIPSDPETGDHLEPWIPNDPDMANPEGRIVPDWPPG